MSKTAIDFLDKPVWLLFPNGRLDLGILASDNQGNFGFRGGEGFNESLISEVREIEAPITVNMIRAVIVLKDK